MPDSPIPVFRYFTSRIIDDAPELLQESYNLRFQVYCLERGFLAAGDYPDELEIDPFDRHSVHIGILNLQQEMVGTARLIEYSDRGFPMFQHCSRFDDSSSLKCDDGTERLVEVSRLAISRKYNRRAGDGFYGLQGATGHNGQDRREGGELVLCLYKALYQASKRRGHTHWLAATEKSLQRLVAKYGFPFKAIGPETDYYGRVSPYLMDLHEFDQVILSRRISLLGGFLEDLEPEYTPIDESMSRPAGAF